MEPILQAIEAKRSVLNDTADFLWDHPETAFTEFESAKYLCEVLRKEGFTVEENVAGIATAFSGTFGSGKPVIGILGEFDALSGLSQVAGIAQQVSAGGEAGHGCGHNLLGAGSLGAAIGVKAWLEKTGNPGTVIYYIRLSTYPRTPSGNPKLTLWLSLSILKHFFLSPEMGCKKRRIKYYGNK